VSPIRFLSTSALPGPPPITGSVAPGVDSSACMKRRGKDWAGWFAGGASDSAADRLPDAAEVLVDMVDVAADDDLLRGHGGPPRERDAALCELLVGEIAHDYGSRRPLLVERDRLRLGSCAVFLRMLGVHRVKHGQHAGAMGRPVAVGTVDSAASHNSQVARGG
jgi:hypothetical protein